VSGDLALQNLPFGGLYLVGGVARAIAPYLDQFGFAEAFFAKGRFADFMRNFPVSVIEDDYAALIGSAQFLRSQSV
jgi:glucokinase